MENLLVINASPQGEASHSRQMTARFTRRWAENNPDGVVVERDLGRWPVPHVDQQWISAAFTPEEARTPNQRAALEVSDALVAELQDATTIVIGCPMHNLSVPSTLKAYIDQVVRIGVTTKLVPDTPQSPYVGLLSDKPTYLMLVRGGYGYEPGGAYAPMNFQEPYLTAVLGMLGIQSVKTITLEYTAMNSGCSDNALEDTNACIDRLFE
ncbi:MULTISPECIES: FMN-dependent NADH-azoreductase [Marinobacter]|uniref:FMN dependent NADH:quinone oxidoreductase n=1 Tax=Marinobacter metalliresistant TaxID=2961995 RepID=A0ABZ2VY26_9GAMM|nr:NAD(P)H-dependent oxidoreductase [Marinobacter sp. Arc7-DN-1]